MKRPDWTFPVYWMGQGISSVGDAFAFVALPLLVLEATGSVSEMGFVSALSAAGQLVMGLFSGGLVDRVDRRRLMIACDLGRAAIFGLLPLWWKFVGHGIWPIYVVAVSSGAVANVFAVAYVTAVAEIVPRERLNEANARLQGSQAVAYVLGPMLAGIFAARTGAVVALFFDALSFLASAVSLALIQYGAAHPTAAVRSDEPLAGVRFVLQEPVLRSVAVLLVLLGLLSSVGLGAGVIDLIVFRLKHDLGAGDRVVGLVVGLGAAGAVAGALAAPTARRRFGFGPCFVGGTFFQGIGLLVAGSFGTAASIAAGSSLWSAGFIVRSIPTVSLRQEITPAPLLGRVTAAFWTLTFGASALGSALVTRAGAAWGTHYVLAGLGVAISAIGVVAILSPAGRSLRRSAVTPVRTRPV